MFLCIDLSDWMHSRFHEQNIFEDAWFEAVKICIQCIMIYIENLVVKYPKLRKISYLLNTGSAISTRIINYQIQNQNRIPLNPIVISETEKRPKNWSKTEQSFEHFLVKKLWEGCRNGGSTVREESEKHGSEVYDPMQADAGWSLSDADESGERSKSGQFDALLEALQKM